MRAPRFVTGLCIGILSALSLPVCLHAQHPLLREGRKFLCVPYVAHTLDQDSLEQLVVRCDQVDCTTFVEYALARALTVGTDSTTRADSLCRSEAFARQLRQIRYRRGRIAGYTSRLHYITEWIENGVAQGFLTDVTATHSPYRQTVELGYMSAHPQLYRQLARSPRLVAQMKAIERRLSGQEVGYLPKHRIPASGLPWIHDGDILAITTTLPGLDVCHLGLACYRNGQLHLLHASSTQKKVVVSQMPLSHLMQRNKLWSGIRVLRMKD